MAEESTERSSCLVLVLQILGQLLLVELLLVTWPLMELGVPSGPAFLMAMALMVAAQAAFFFAMRRYWERREVREEQRAHTPPDYAA